MNIPAESFSCLSYNIHKGFSANNRHYILSEIRDAIRDTSSDLIALQEVIGVHHQHAASVDDWPREAHFEYLADSVWRHYGYGKNAIYQHGHHGNALLSKYPFKSLFNQDISQWRFSQRGLLHGEIHPFPNAPKTAVHIACVHMGFMPFEQYRQNQKLCQWINNLPSDAALIILGDFNDWHRQIHRALTQKFDLKEATCAHNGKPQATFPSHAPKLPMDRIYYRGLKLVRSEVLTANHWANLSDHCPVYAKFLLED